MSGGYNNTTESYTAGADLSDKEGFCVKVSGANVVLATDGTIAGAELHRGVVSTIGDGESGERVSIVINGRTRGKAGGVLTRGTDKWLTCNASGEFIAAAAGDVIIADWVDDGSDAAGADLDWIEIFVNIRPYPTGTLGGGTGATDNVILRADGAGGVTVQGGGVATLSDAGAIAGLTGVTLASGNIVLSGAGATVDGVDLDTAIRGALGGTDNAVLRADGAGGVTAQGSLLVINDAGAASGITGLTMTGNITLSDGGATVDGRDLTVDGAIIDGLRKVTMTPGAEAADAIDVVLNVVDGNGNAVAAATRVLCRAYSPTATTITLSEQGAGSTLFVTAADIFPAIAVETDANGDATVRVAFADAGTVGFEAVVAPASGASVHGFPVCRDLVFA